MTTCPYGFRIVGGTRERRRLVSAAAALAGYAACDVAAEITSEAYLSAFQFGDDFRDRADQYGTLDVREFTGACWSPFIWFDIDREDNLHQALTDARRLAVYLDERHRLGDDDLLVFFSGSKGFHVGLPTALWSPEPATTFHRAARRFAEQAAERANVRIDTGVYDKVRAFRAPNSRHPKTGLHKRRLSLDELMGLSLDAVLNMATEPASFDLPTPTKTSDLAAADWLDARTAAEQDAAYRAQRKASGNGMATLNRATLEFIRDGAGLGDRHRLLYSCAANLAEFGCPLDLAVALLTEAGLDSGLPPKEVRRQIECGLAATPYDTGKGVSP